MTAKKGVRPYAAVPHDVIDSAAYADLSGEAVRLLLIITRQTTAINNNGWLHAAYSFCRFKGLGSESTLRRAVASLVSHGFIFKTRGHGIDHVTGNNMPARYALTWLPLTKNRKGLFCDGFVPNAFEKWLPEKKSGVSNLTATPGQICSFSEADGTESPPVKSKGSRTGNASGESVKTDAYELVPVYGVRNDGEPHDEVTNREPNNRPPRNLASVTSMPIGKSGDGLKLSGGIVPTNAQTPKKGEC